MGTDLFSIREANLRCDADAVLAVWRSSLGRPELAADKLRWFYRDEAGPAGVVLTMWFDGGGTRACIGAAGIGTRLLRVGARTLTAGLLADFAVVPEHRSLLPALRLQRAARVSGLERHAWVYGMPNAKAVPVLKRLGDEVLARLGRYVRVVRHSPYLSRRLPGVAAPVAALVPDSMAWVGSRMRLGRRMRSRWIERPDERFDRLWGRVAEAHPCIAVRDARFLRWRFADAPGARFAFLAIERVEDDELVAYAVCERIDATLHVRDLLGDAAAHRPLLGALCIEARRAGAAGVSIEHAGSTALLAALSDAGFSMRSERPVYGARAAGAAPVDLDRWYLTAADEDQ